MTEKPISIEAEKLNIPTSEQLDYPDTSVEPYLPWHGTHVLFEDEQGRWLQADATDAYVDVTEAR